MSSNLPIQNWLRGSGFCSGPTSYSSWYSAAGSPYPAAQSSAVEIYIAVRHVFCVHAAIAPRSCFLDNAASTKN